jgi:hypothetical protein
MLAKILKSGARALAGYAAGEMPLDAGAAHATASTQFDGWQNVLAARLEELAVAISTGRPEFFVEQVHWTRAALDARGIPSEMLRGRLEALRRVLVEQIPAELAPMATGYIDRALAEFGGEPAGLTPRLMAETPAERLAATYLLSILEGDRRKAIRLILKAADEAVCGFWVRSMSGKSILPRQQPAWSWPSSTHEEFADPVTARRWLLRQLPATSMIWVSKSWPIYSRWTAGG